LQELVLLGKISNQLNSCSGIRVEEANKCSFMAAAWARVYGVKTLLIDQRASKIENGHADGLQSRTFEILHSFGFGDQIHREANWQQEVCFWVRMQR
jgi:phenol 2-monooxygenase